VPCHPEGCCPAAGWSSSRARWGTGAGLSAAECRKTVLRHREEAVVRQLADDPALWGGAVDDERYVVVSRR
jgi:hypothetical protein